jgi:thiol-disulfide isomerase/thioredoxin
MMGNSASTLSYDNPASLALKLQSQKSVLLTFLSPTCTLCQALQPYLAEVGKLHILCKDT